MSRYDPTLGILLIAAASMALLNSALDEVIAHPNFWGLWFAISDVAIAILVARSVWRDRVR